MINAPLRTRFDVNNEAHLHTYRQFLAEGRWGSQGCPFKSEYPWISVPAMINDKIVAKFLSLPQGEHKFTQTSINEETSST